MKGMKGSKPQSLRQKFVQACFDVADDIDAGATYPKGYLCTEKGAPSCAIGQVAVRCGVAPHNAVALFDFVEVSPPAIYVANDNRDWPSCANALRYAAKVAARAT